MKLFSRKKNSKKREKLMNHTLRILMISDIFVLTGFGLIAPILAIFINDNLIGGSIFSAGLASTIFLLTSSLLQIFFSYVFNPKDRLWMLKLGTAIIAIIPFGYALSTTIYHIYAMGFLYGLGAAFAYPAWSSLFTSHLEKGKRGLQYSIYSSGVGLGTAATAAIGGWIADKLSLDIGFFKISGFQIVFFLTGMIAVGGLLLLFRIQKKALRKT